MLKRIERLSDICFGDLMGVYEEGNRENAQELYGHMDRNAAMIQAEQDFYGYLSQVFFQTEGAYYAVWAEKGRYVSALRLEPYQDGLLLEGLETAPGKRRKGYAKKLITAALKSVDLPVYSHVNKGNAASLATHYACGFVRISEQATLIDGTVVEYCCTLLRKRGKG